MLKNLSKAKEKNKKNTPKNKNNYSKYFDFYDDIKIDKRDIEW